MKQSKYILISLCSIGGALIIACVVNVLFKIDSDGIFSAEWSAGDALNYVGSMVGAISTFVLSLVAYKQNEKLQKLEDNNYIASNSCMVLISKIYIKPKVSIPINYKWHGEQILCEMDNKDRLPSGYEVEIILSKLGSSTQSIPSLIYASKCTFFVGDNREGVLESIICTENLRDGYTRMAIFEEGIAFKGMILVTEDKQAKFEEAIKEKNNSLTIEIDFNIITDKYVMTKCKCRAYCSCYNDNGVIAWRSKKPMVFFYGHELKKRDEIQVLGEE